jgi:tetratricopeptide (TPR) repeat protein
MVYSLIPPILIILSLIGIIVMLLKKSKQVANLSLEEIAAEEGVFSKNAGLLGKMGWKIKSIHWDDAKHFFLAILEKITRKSRIVFLKLEARFAGWSNDIREAVVTPHLRAEIKDRLEDLLIERIAVNPKDIEAYERLGEYYMEIKSYMDAKECFKQVLKLSPSDKNARYRMQRLENILSKQ